MPSAVHTHTQPDTQTQLSYNRGPAANIKKKKHTTAANRLRLLLAEATEATNIYIKLKFIFEFDANGSISVFVVAPLQQQHTAPHSAFRITHQF